jgi:hypothetical protein
MFSEKHAAIVSPSIEISKLHFLLTIFNLYASRSN